MKKGFEPDMKDVDIRKKLNKEEHQYLQVLLQYLARDLSEKTLENCCLPASLELEEFMAYVAEDNGLSAEELCDTVKTALFGLLRKYTIINLAVSKQAFQHEMK